jgi:NAD(P)-dependent dehydrogenase (short-subunit alcohol dehydrogenase family)
MDFRDRHVVVTGGTGALGRAVVDALLAQLVHVMPRRSSRGTVFMGLRTA